MMPQTELYIDCWNRLCDDALAGGFDLDRAHRFADANADALYQNRLRDRLDETVMLQREALLVTDPEGEPRDMEILFGPGSE